MIVRLAMVFMIFAFAALADGPLYGIYENLGFAPEGMTLEAAVLTLSEALEYDEGFELLHRGPVTPPDHVREDAGDRDGRRGYLIVFIDEAYLNALADLHPKYAAAGMMRLGLSEEPGGLRITMLQPETLARIVGNDLEDETLYAAMAGQAAALAGRIRDRVSSAFGKPTANEPMPPLRDRDRLREGKKDMFMMVGPMTYFRSEGQFPLLHSEAVVDDATLQMNALADRITANLAAFTPDGKDLKYRWTPDPDADLKWKLAARKEVPGKAILLGITRPRTEALAMHIAGMKRAEGDWRSPGLDHVCAFPIEVLIYLDGDEIQVRSAKEMFRMDQFFWDAGKGAFMKYASMPGMLDGSIRRALLGE